MANGRRIGSPRPNAGEGPGVRGDLNLSSIERQRVSSRYSVILKYVEILTDSRSLSIAAAVPSVTHQRASLRARAKPALGLNP